MATYGQRGASGFAVRVDAADICACCVLTRHQSGDWASNDLQVSCCGQGIGRRAACIRPSIKGATELQRPCKEFTSLGTMIWSKACMEAQRNCSGLVSELPISCPSRQAELGLRVATMPALATFCTDGAPPAL